MFGKSGSQVSAKSGVYWHVHGNPGGERPSLTVLQRVRCLECGALYAKPADGGTVRQNPGCPDCGYVGWATMGVSRFNETSMRRRSGAGHLRHRSG
jgi:hypothetical protein